MSSKEKKRKEANCDSYILTFQNNIICASIFTPLIKQIISLDEWYTKATHSQNQWDRAEQITQQRGMQTFQIFSPSPRMTKDPNTIGVDMVNFPKKSTIEEKEQCAKKGLCFCCYKNRHIVSTCSIFSETPKKPHIQHACKEENTLGSRKLKMTMKTNE